MQWRPEGYRQYKARLIPVASEGGQVSLRNCDAVLSASGELYRRGQSKLEEENMPCLPTVDRRIPKLSSAALRVHEIGPRRASRLLTLLAVVVPAALPAPAANYTWDGNPPSGNGSSFLSRPFNWVGNNRPPANTVSGLLNSDITFSGTLKLTPILDNDYYFHSVTFASGAGAFQIVPVLGQTLYLGGGGITNRSTSTATIATTLSLQANQTWDALSGALAVNALLDLNNNNLIVAGNFATSISGQILDIGSVTKNGLGNLILGGSTANTFSGGFTINAGTVTANKANALGTGPLTLSGGVLNLGAYTANVSAVSLLGGSITSTSGSISSSSGYQFQAGSVASHLGGTGGLSKTSSGVVTLSAANTYTGGTWVSGGKLVVNNLIGSGTGSGPVLVSGGGLLTGSGFIGGLVTNGPGGSISAGDEIGVLNLGPTIWFGGATNRWDIANATGTAGVGWDLLSINGSLTILGTAGNKAIIDVVSFTLGGQPGLAANFDPTQNYLWSIVQTTGGINFLPGENESTVFDLLVNHFGNLATGTFTVGLSPDSRSLNVGYTPVVVVPEPSRFAMFGLSLCGFIYLRRFKTNWMSPRREGRS